MILGYAINGMLLGMISAAISLFLGSSVLWPLVVYTAAGSLGVLLSAAIVYVLSKLSESGTINMKASSLVFGCQYPEESYEAISSQRDRNKDCGNTSLWLICNHQVPCRRRDREFANSWVGGRTQTGTFK